MSYDRYKHVIEKKLSACPPSVLEAFCQDVALRIIPFVNRSDKSSLRPRELELINILADMVRCQSLNWEIAGEALDELTIIAEQDDEHAIEMDGDLIQFLSALDGWRDVAMTGKSEAAAAVSESLMNILDFYFVKDTPLEKWLSVPPLREELTTQIKFLEGTA